MKTLRFFHFLSRLGLLAALGWFYSGCTTAGLSAGDATYGSSYLIVDDASLARQISITDVEIDRVGNLMRGYAALQSNRGRSLQIQYRFSWYDANGREIDGTRQPYRDLILRGRDSVPVTSVAPSPQAVEFKIRVQKVRALRIENIR